ncbi:uncharacterized protein [Eurosta solidaginis]
MNSPLCAPSFTDELQLPHRKSVQLAHQHMDSATMAAQLRRRFEQLLRSEKFFDCVFHIVGKQLKCHKLILATASPVFEAMFYGPLREQTQEIEILDISIEIFQMLLNYIYAGSIDLLALTLEEAIELYYCAEKYLIADLIHSCLLAIARKLRYDNILPALELCVCMDLHDLLEVCMSFFSRCCLNNPQYMTAHKQQHYVHVSKECMKAIIKANKNENASKHMLWFVYDWCQQECHALGVKQEDYDDLIINDLQLPAYVNGDVLAKTQEQQQYTQQQKCNIIERSYFKACPPLIINQHTHEWSLLIKCDRFIAFRGLIICSRLTPNLSHLAAYYAYAALNATSEYSENFQIKILAPAICNNQKQQQIQNNSDSDDESDDNDVDDKNADANTPKVDDSIIWQHNVTKKQTKYNCDMHIDWGEGLLLTPEIEYKIKLLWQKDAYGSEYPCSLQSDLVDGISFRDVPLQCGSLIKGLRFTNLN